MNLFKNYFFVAAFLMAFFSLVLVSFAAASPYKIKIRTSAIKNDAADIRWQVNKNAQKKIKSFAVTLIDKSAQGKPTVSVVGFNIPASARTLSRVALPKRSDSPSYEIDVFGLSSRIKGPQNKMLSEEAFRALIKGKVIAKGSLQQSFDGSKESPSATVSAASPSPSPVMENKPADIGSTNATAKIMSFFVTSRGNGEKGGNYGGLSGADDFCKNFARESTIADAGSKTWAAYLSSAGPRINAVDRIGSGPWYNFNGKKITKEMFAAGIPYDDLLDEKGDTVEVKNEHDIVTGSQNDGTLAVIDGNPHTCSDWNDGSDISATTVGHANWNTAEGPQSWNSQHTVSCSAESFRQSAGVGRLYCFATN